MATEENLWWSQEFPSYSLSALEAMPIYQELMKWINTGIREKDAYWTKMNLTDTSRSIIKRSLNHTRSESLHLDQDSNTWTWELNEKKPRYDLKTVASKQGEKQWGQVIKRFPGYQLEESWKVEGAEKAYEKVRIENGVRRSHRPGMSEVIQWTEDNSYGFKAHRPWDSDRFEAQSPLSSSDRAHTEPYITPKNRPSLRVSAYSFVEDTKEDTSPIWDMGDSSERLTSRSFKGSVGFRREEDREDWGRRSVDTAGVGLSSLENLCDREWEGTIKSLELVEGLAKDRQEVKTIWTKLRTMEEQPCSSPGDWLRRIHELRDMQDYLNEVKSDLFTISAVPSSLIEAKTSVFSFNEEQIHSFFPHFLTAKFVDDLSHFQQAQSPLTLLEFLPIYLHQNGGQHPSDVLQSLQDWKGKGNHRAAILCELLIGEEAVAYLLGLFVVRVRMEFGRMAKGETASLLDILRFTTLLFGPEKASSQEAALALKPTSLPAQDFSPIAQRLRSSAFRANISGIRVTEEDFVAAMIETGRKKERKGAIAAGEVYERAGSVKRLEEIVRDLEPGISQEHLQTVCVQTSLSKAKFLGLLRYYPIGPTHHSVFSKA